MEKGLAGVENSLGWWKSFGSKDKCRSFDCARHDEL